MRARTIGQIATLIAGHLGGGSSAPAAATPGAVPETAAAPASVVPAAGAPTAEVDLDALSDEDIDRLLGGVPEAENASR